MRSAPGAGDRRRSATPLPVAVDTMASLTAGTTAFAEAVRRELVERPPAKACCRSAFLSGIVRPSGALQLRTGGELAVQLELGEPSAVRLVFAMLRRLGAETEIVHYREPRFARRPRLVLRLHGDRSLQLLHEIGILGTTLAPLPGPPRRLLGRSCCRAAYLRGAFVAGGSLAPPHRPAHLELRAATVEAAAELAGIAGRDGFRLRALRRRSHAIVYAKRRETVRDLLAFVGAHDAVLSFDEAATIARTRETANRLTNCDGANVARASRAAHVQREAIRRLDLDRLDPGLRTVAELRLRHPELALAELGRQAAPPLSKSAVARRMKVLTRLTNP
jgi:cell division protein WhiA